MKPEKSLTSYLLVVKRKAGEVEILFNGLIYML